MYYSYDIVYGVANEEKVGQGIYSHEVSKKVLKISPILILLQKKSLCWFSQIIS